MPAATHTTPNSSSQLLSLLRVTRLELIPSMADTKIQSPKATLCLPCQQSSLLLVTYVYCSASFVLLIWCLHTAGSCLPRSYKTVLHFGV